MSDFENFEARFELELGGFRIPPDNERLERTVLVEVELLDKELEQLEAGMTIDQLAEEALRHKELLGEDWF